MIVSYEQLKNFIIKSVPRFFELEYILNIVQNIIFECY